MVKVFENVKYSPTPLEIREVAKAKGIKKFSPDFLSDLACVFAGEKPRKISEIEKELQEKALSLSFEKDGDGDYYCLDGSGYTKSLDQMRNSWTAVELKKLKRLQDFLKDVPDIPGETPLNKAANLVKKLSEKGKAGDSSEDGESGPPIFCDSDEATSKVQEKVNQDIKILESLDREDHEFLESGGSSETAYLEMNDMARNLLKVEQFCRQNSKLQFNPRSSLVKDPEGDFNFFRASRDIGDLPKTGKTALLQRSRIGHYLLNREGRVSEKYRKQQPTPFVTMILDKSGSMDGENSQKGLGFLYYLCKQVKQKNTLGLFAFFEQRCYQFTLLTPEMDPIEWFRKTSKTSFNERGTDVGACAIEALEKFEEVVKENQLEVDTRQKHLVLINDGQDRIGDFSANHLKGGVLHAFILGNTNKDLQKVCIQTKGQYFENL